MRFKIILNFLNEEWHVIIRFLISFKYTISKILFNDLIEIELNLK